MHILRLSDHVTAAFMASVDAALRRLDGLSLGTFPVFVLQDAPRAVDRDAEALARNTATRRAAIRCWRLESDAALARGLFINAYPEDPRRLGRPFDVGAARVEAALRRCGARVSAVVAAGAWQRGPVSRVLGLRCVLSWNEVLHAGSLEVVAVPHPSPRNRLYNAGGVGTWSAPLVCRFLRC